MRDILHQGSAAESCLVPSCYVISLRLSQAFALQDPYSHSVEKRKRDLNFALTHDCRLGTVSPSGKPFAIDSSYDNSVQALKDVKFIC